MFETNNPYSGYRDIRVALLGASGFIGRWVARALCRQNAQVALIVRNKPAAEKVFLAIGVEGDVFEQDLRNTDAISGLFQVIKPSITFNLAGYGVDNSERDEETSFQINERLVETVCKAVAKVRDADWQGQHIVHAGSALEYGSAAGVLSENSIPNPTTVYGKSKLAGTNSLASCCVCDGIAGITARLFTVYGPGEHCGRLLPSLIRTAKSGEGLQLTSGAQKRDFTYVEDVADALLRLGLTKGKSGEIVNLATGRLTSVRSFAETAARILEIPRKRLKFGSIPTRPEEMEHSEVSLERLRRLIGSLPPTGIEDGIRKTLAVLNRRQTLDSGSLKEFRHDLN
jgi:nucleoside-diphosphate-sugar epimerase